MEAKSLRVAACIPAYNEEKTIAKVVLKAKRHVDVVVVCDDGSKDMTAEIAEALGAIVIRHERNLGYGAALASLFRKAKELGVDVMVTLDADGQHDPDDIPKLLEPIKNGDADIVIGSRFIESSDSIPAYRRLGIKIITAIARWVSYEGVTDAQSGFRAYNRRAIEATQPSESGMGASTEILIKARVKRLRVREVPIEITYGSESSTHNPLAHGIDVVLSTIKHYSIRHPLKLYGIPGFLSMGVALFFWIWTLQIFSQTRQVVTNIALIAIGATIVGLVLLTTAALLWTLVSVVEEK